MVKSDLSEIEKMQINILLNEYQACHRNRNHYDSVRWTIGSLFIGASLTLFGISIVKEVETFGVIIACFFSLGLIMIWYLYSQHVNPYILASIIRARDIEKEFNEQTYKIELHTLIKSLDPPIIFNVKGTKITFSLVLLILGMWFLRMLSLVYSLNRYGEISAIFAIPIISFLLIVFWIYHNKFNQDIEKKIEDQLIKNKKRGKSSD